MQININKLNINNMNKILFLNNENVIFEEVKSLSGIARV